MPAHVFVDTTNIFLGARSAAARFEPEAPIAAVRLHYPNLFRLIEGQYQVATRVLAGSIVGPGDALNSIARKARYEAFLFDTASQGNGKREQSVDELLHLKIANCVLDHAGEQTLVLVTGDGQESNSGTSFPGQLERALKRGWSVDIWSWRLQLSGAYRFLASNPRCRVQTLDPYYRNITFVKGGKFGAKGFRGALDGSWLQQLALP